jgi:hypothetical protein
MPWCRSKDCDGPATCLILSPTTEQTGSGRRCVLQLPFVENGVINNAITEAGSKKKPPAITKLRLEEFSEGWAAQILHIGPFADEGPAIERLHEFIDARSGKARKHHEIYLSDIRRGDPGRWKTIMRQPMK